MTEVEVTRLVILVDVGTVDTVVVGVTWVGVIDRVEVVDVRAVVEEVVTGLEVVCAAVVAVTLLLVVAGFVDVVEGLVEVVVVGFDDVVLGLLVVEAGFVLVVLVRGVVVAAGFVLVVTGFVVVVVTAATTPLLTTRVVPRLTVERVCFDEVDEARLPKLSVGFEVPLPSSRVGCVALFCKLSSRSCFLVAGPSNVDASRRQRLCRASSCCWRPSCSSA